MNKKFLELAKKSKVIVIKVGSNILVNEKHVLRKKWLKSLIDDVKETFNGNVVNKMTISSLR